MTSLTLQRMCTWSGLIGIVLFTLGFVICGFIPPLTPDLTQAQVTAYYQQHATAIRIGMVVMLISGMFVSPLVGVISNQMRRMHQVPPAMSYAQISAGTANVMFFMIAPVIFLVTAYRPERSAELTYTLNDLGWTMAVIPWPPAFMQSLVIGISVMSDRSPHPVFPRWFGYLNFWVALGYVPGALLPFFKHGPLAWSGLLVFWLAGSVFILWFIAMIVVTLRAISAEQREFSS